MTCFQQPPPHFNRIARYLAELTKYPRRGKKNVVWESWRDYQIGRTHPQTKDTGVVLLFRDMAIAQGTWVAILAAESCHCTAHVHMVRRLICFQCVCVCVCHISYTISYHKGVLEDDSNLLERCTYCTFNKVESVRVPLSRYIV